MQIQTHIYVYNKTSKIYTNWRGLSELTKSFFYYFQACDIIKHVAMEGALEWESCVLDLVRESFGINRGRYAGRLQGATMEHGGHISGSV
jgi:hypothetical protein